MGKIRNWLRRAQRSEAGQSLVEMMIATPLLIFMMIGVFEVGWALRNYLVLVNVSREITRFAVRPGYMNFSTSADVEASFDRVRGWVDTTISGQIPLDFTETDGDGDGFGDGNATVIISHIVADTGFPCEDIDSAACSSCDAFADPTYNPFPYDDIIIHPGMANFGYQTATYGPVATVTGPRATRQINAGLIDQVVADNNKFNCEVIKKAGVPSANNLIVTELFYDQPQLFGFPLISNPYTDPVPLYSHTTMRLIGAARSAGKAEGSLVAGIDTIGPICLAYPLVIGSNVPHGSKVDILPNGWLKWNPAATLPDQDYLEYSLQFPQMSLNDFEGGAQILQIGSQVGKIGGGTQPDETIVKNLATKSLVIPTSASPGSDPVVIDGFVWVTIQSETDVVLSGSPPFKVEVVVDKLTEVPVACQPGT
jgi:hypothetical protein